MYNKYLKISDKLHFLWTHCHANEFYKQSIVLLSQKALLGPVTPEGGVYGCGYL